MKKYIYFILTTLIFYGCATYYHKNIQLQSYITQGNYKSADKLLKANKKGDRGINRVLYYLNNGVVKFMLGDYELSNQYFNKADLYIEDFQKGLSSEALSLITNPMVKPYKPEDFESVMIHYYKALNYLFLKKYDEALVECRRMNITLQILNDKFKKTKNKYANDAFAHNLMGMIYEASGDINNAFIAYRNAYNGYEDEYAKLFALPAPTQLKKDLLRCAYQIGFMEDYNFYKDKFDMTYQPDSTKKGELIFMWMNGFGPVKSEWSINFTNAGYNSGWVTFVNEEYGFNFPIYIGSRKQDEQNAFKNLSFLRVAFPKYVERKPYFNHAVIEANGQSYPLELTENINGIAFQSLHDRLVRELANSIARLVTKKALETLANKKDDNFGTIVSIINAITEKADTRNWQSLPYAIHYTRIPLDEGKQTIKLITNSNDDTASTEFEFNIKKGKTEFFTYHQLESNSIP